jgi:small conductance mechanosensitive channel
MQHRAIRIIPLLLALAGTAAGAETPPPAGTDDIEELVSVLEDDQRRAELVAELRLLIEARRAAEPTTADAGLEAVDDLFSSAAKRIEKGGKQLRKSFGALLDLPSLSRELWKRAQHPRTRDRWLEMGWKILLVFFTGLAAQKLASLLLARQRRRAAGSGEQAGTGTLRRVLAILADLLPLFVFAGIAAGVLTLLDPRTITRVLALALIAAFFFERLISRIAAGLLLRGENRLPLIAMDAETASYLYVWIRRLSIVSVYGYFAIHAGRVLSFPAAVRTLLDSSVGLLLAAMLVVLVLQNRQPVADWIRGARDAQPGALRAARAFLAGLWVPATVLGIVAVYGIWLFSVKGGFQFLLRATLLSLLIVAVARFVIYLIGAAVRRGFRISAEMRLRYPELESRVNRYVPLMERLARLVVYVAAALAVIDVWGLGVYEWLESDAGSLLTAKALRIVLILVLSLAVWEILSALIHRYLDRHEPGAGVLRPASSRVRTLLPVFQNLMLIAIGAVAGISILAEIGINIAPLLAGAGVVGLAIGVGAQSLVKDVITGIFIILEDSIALGDIVEIGGHTGVVEGITIRTLRLRDLDGVVHTVPFGNINEVRNLTKDFSYALIEIGVSYREDVDEVIKLLEEIGEAMRQDPELGPRILEPMEMLGLDSFGDSSVNLRMRFKTQAGERWRIRREFNRRVKQAFDERGIEIPYPHRTIFFGVDRAGDAPAARVRMEPGPAGGA